MTARKKIITAGIAVLTVCIVISCIFLIPGRQKKDIDDMPIVYDKAELAYDKNDLRTLVGLVDYVFIGTITECDSEPHYGDVINGAEGKTYAVPYTYYTVEVTENIKGNLQTGIPIQLIKHGGIGYQKDYVELYDGDDSLPIVGGTYIFSAFGQPDGSILLSGPGSNVLIDELAEAENGIATYSTASTSKIDEFLGAYENEIVYDRERYVSTYEVQP